jgi:predicted Na+-dependent transporter
MNRMSGRRFRADPQLASHPTVSRPGQTTANPADDSLFVTFTDIVEEYLLLWVLLSVGVGLGAVALNVAGYAVGWLVGNRASRRTHVASILSVGMRDFAVAAGLPAVAFGVVEMVTSAGLAKWFPR